MIRTRAKLSLLLLVLVVAGVASKGQLRGRVQKDCDQAEAGTPCPAAYAHGKGKGAGLESITAKITSAYFDFDGTIEVGDRLAHHVFHELPSVLPGCQNAQRPKDATKKGCQFSPGVTGALMIQALKNVMNKEFKNDTAKFIKHFFNVKLARKTDGAKTFENGAESPNNRVAKDQGIIKELCDLKKNTNGEVQLLTKSWGVIPGAVWGDYVNYLVNNVLPFKCRDDVPIFARDHILAIRTGMGPNVAGDTTDKKGERAKQWIESENHKGKTLLFQDAVHVDNSDGYKEEFKDANFVFVGTGDGVTVPVLQRLNELALKAN